MIIKDHQRTCGIERNTKEVSIMAKINLDGTGNSSVTTGIDFLDHIIISFSKHSKIDLKLCGLPHVPWALGDVDFRLPPRTIRG